MTLHQQLLTSTRWHVFVTVVLLLASFAVQVGIARHFALVGLGEYVGTSIAIFLASVVAVNGLPLAASHEIATRLERGDVAGSMRAASSGLVMALLSSLAVGVVASLAWPPVALALNLHEPLPSWSVGVAVVFAGAMHFVPLTFQARFRIATAGIITLAQPFAAVLLIALDVVVPGSVRPAAISVAGFVLGGTVALALFLALELAPPSREEIRLLGSRAIHSLPLLYASTFSTWVDRLMVSLLLGPAVLGTYQAAAILIEGVLRLPRNLSPFLVSAYARMSSRSAGSVERLAGAHSRLWVAAGCVAASGLFAGADGLATTLFGAGSTTVADPLRFLCLALVPGLVGLLLATLTTGAASANPAVVSVISIVAQVASMLVLAPRFGAVGAALAYDIAVICTAGTYLVISARRHVGVPVVRIVVVAALSLAPALLVASVPIAWPLRTLAASAVAAAVAWPALLGPDEWLVVRLLARRERL